MKALAVLGGLVACVVVVLGVMSLRATRAAHTQEPFVRKFMFDYARRWNPVDVYGRLSTDFLSDLESPSGRQAIAFGKRLGRLEKISDMSLRKWYVGTGGKRYLFEFKARFEAAPTVVDLTLIDSDGRVRVEGLQVTPTVVPSPITPTRSPI